MLDERSRRAWRLAAALVAAAVLHLPLLLLEPLGEARQTERPDVRSVRLVHVPPPEPTATEAQSSTLPPGRSHAATTRARAIERVVPTTEPTEPTAERAEPATEPVEPTKPGGPRKVDLYPAEAIARAATPSPDPSATERVRQRLAAWNEQFAGAGRARIGDDTPALRELGRRIGDWLLMSGQAGEALRRAAPLGLGGASTPLAMFNAWQQEVEARRTIGRPHEQVPRHANPLMDHGPIESFVSLCWGDCSGYLGHRVSYLVVTIEIEHDHAGIPETWRVWESSGDRRFDEAALEAIEDALAWAPAGALASERPAEYSRWEVSASAHRFHRGETLLDPTFVPPGDLIDEHTGITGITTLIKRARLVAVRYRESELPRSTRGQRG